MFSLSGVCSCTAKPTVETKNDIDMKTDGKKLVVFFSHAGENYNVGVIEKGNTRIIADMIADAVGADRFEIVPAKPYPVNYNECIEVAKDEKQSGARPAINGDVKIEDYDVIFLGYPNWWGEMPMCVYTFIEQHDWTGKTVIPFITHEGSGMGGTDRKIANACKGADVAVCKGLAVQGKIAQEQQEVAGENVDKWLSKLGF
ncbi:MAG: flavodoxin [Paramuribaculum sp.]|nr:flavodoxin [Paramuribaculum sp.]